MRPRRGNARPDPVWLAPVHRPLAATRYVLGVEYLIRQARITDIDRLAALGRSALRGSGRGSLDAADLFRQLVYLPHASVIVAEVRRELVGGALLVLRPSVTAGGYVGTVDLLVVAPDHDADRVTDALLEELLRSAGNKGCTEVEMAQPTDPTDLARYERAGFAPAGPMLRRPLAAAGPARRP
jgi:GNAT superfamily N-acetyltransferase